MLIVLLDWAGPSIALGPTQPRLGVCLPNDLLQTKASPAIRVPVHEPDIQDRTVFLLHENDDMLRLVLGSLVAVHVFAPGPHTLKTPIRHQKVEVLSDQRNEVVDLATHERVWAEQVLGGAGQ
jgi:hypothetical protein